LGLVQELHRAGGPAFLLLCRYVESNPLRAKLVRRTKNWLWSSSAAERGEDWPELSPWPVARPRNWMAMLNRPMDERKARRCV
jgi:putative transposase